MRVWLSRADKLHADDTPVDVLQPGRGTTKTGRIIEAACWAHACRKFHDIQQADRLPIAAEALGRKNYLLAGSDAGGERAAAICSLLGTAKRNALVPEAYLRTVTHEHRGKQLTDVAP